MKSERPGGSRRSGAHAEKIVTGSIVLWTIPDRVMSQINTMT